MTHHFRCTIARMLPGGRLLATAASVAMVVLLCTAAVALAKPGDKVIADWRADNHIDHKYSLAELDAAKARIGNSQLEYTSFGKELERARSVALIDASGGKNASGVGNGGPNKTAVLVVGVLILLVLAATGWYYLRAGGSAGARARGKALDDDRQAGETLTGGTAPTDSVDSPTEVIDVDRGGDAPTEVIDTTEPGSPPHDIH